MDRSATLGFGSETDDGSDVDAHWLALDLFGLFKRLDNGGELGSVETSRSQLKGRATTHVVGTVVHLENLPAHRLELGGRVVRETSVDGSIDGDRVVVVDQDQVIQAKVSGHGDGYNQPSPSLQLLQLDSPS